MVDLKAEYEALKIQRDTTQADLETLQGLKKDVTTIFKYLKQGVKKPNPIYEDQEGVAVTLNQADIDLMAGRGAVLNQFFSAIGLSQLQVFETLLEAIGQGNSNPFEHLIDLYQTSVKGSVGTVEENKRLLNVKLEEIKEFLLSQEGITV